MKGTIDQPITQEQINEAIQLHDLWLRSQPGGQRFVLTGEVKDITLTGNLTHAVIEHANLHQVHFQNVTFNYGLLSHTYLTHCQIHHCRAEHSTLQHLGFNTCHIDKLDTAHCQIQRIEFQHKTHIYNSRWEYALIDNCYFDFTTHIIDTTLTASRIRNSTFSSYIDRVYFTKNYLYEVSFECSGDPTKNIFAFNQCRYIDFDFQATGIDFTNVDLQTRNPGLQPLPAGELIGYAIKNNAKGSQRINTYYLVTLSIPKSAKRSRGNSNKCRAEFVKTKKIQMLAKNRHGDYIITKEQVDEILSTPPGFTFAPPTWYKVGKKTYADEWDSNRWSTCSHGIHFFLTKEEALRYANTI